MEPTYTNQYLKQNGAATYFPIGLMVCRQKKPRYVRA